MVLGEKFYIRSLKKIQVNINSMYVTWRMFREEEVKLGTSHWNISYNTTEVAWHFFFLS